ncbi:MAG: ECF-type sigma factor [Planctomycetota bacterium]
MNDAPISLWLQQLKGGSDSAAQHLWESCFERLCHIARRRLGNLPRRLKDEEDVALSALDALFQGARDGRFERLEDRDDLWRLLATITARKASNVRRAAGRRPEVGESMVGNGSMGAPLDAVAAVIPDDQFVEELDGTSQELLDILDDKLREVALLKLAGYTHDEIARKRNRSIKSIERYMAMIRQRWSMEIGA